MVYDLVLKGGRVIDPSQKRDAVADMSLAGGKLAAIGPNLGDIRDVPGLIDLTSEGVVPGGRRWHPEPRPA